ncbi:MAG: hypothetical protein R6U96_09070 [Promethearchaeia archaeon]
MSDDFTGIIKTLLKGVIICKQNGEHLMDFVLDSEINPIHLSSFAGALSLGNHRDLGRKLISEKLGKDTDITIVKRHGLLLIALMSSDFSQKKIRSEAEKVLDMFNNLYKNELDGCVDVSRLASFRKILKAHLMDYFEKKTQ